MKYNAILLFTLILSLNIQAQKKHPFLIINESDFSELKRKSQKEPFTSMVSYAKDNWKIESKTFTGMSAQLGRISLMYTLETNKEQKDEYKNYALDLIFRWDTLIDQIGYTHRSTVYSAGMLFNSIIALDVLYNDLSAKELKKAENALQPVVEWYKKGKTRDSRYFAWRLARYGVISTWYAYKQDGENLTIWAEKYKSKLLDQSITKDGSWVQSPGYAFARMCNTRIAKSHPIDVLQKIGYYDFYSDEKMIGFMHWLNHFAMTPFGDGSTFGESATNGDFRKRTVLHHFMDKYSEEAAGNSAYLLGEHIAPDYEKENIFIFYTLMPTERAKPQMLKSRLMEHTGVSLWGRVGGEEDLQGILYSQKRENWELGSFHHISEDVNSLGIHGYGEYLLMNGGVNYKPRYPGQTPDGGSWNEAWINNVVTLGNDRRHLICGHGGGLQEGMTGGTVEYGVTHSAGAIRNALHKRGLFMLHEINGIANGYFAVFDDVSFEYHFDTVRVNWQPNSKYGSVKTIQKDLEYYAPVNGFVTEKGETEALNIFFVTPPISVEVTKSYKGCHRETFESDRIRATYMPCRDNHHSRSLTLLFPEDKIHKKADMNKFSEGIFNGVRVQHNPNVFDILIESENHVSQTYKNLTFKAEVIIYRSIDKNTYMTAYRAREYRAEIENQTYGFKSINPVSFQLENNQCTLYGKEGKVTIFHPDAENTKIEEGNANIIEINKGKVTVTLKEAYCTFRFLD